MPNDTAMTHAEHENAHAQQYTSYPDVKTYLSWNAPGRPYQSHGKQYFLSILLIVFLVEVILFLFSEYQLMMAAGALAFLSIALSTVPPGLFHYRVSSEGVKVEDHFYIWSELYDFYFKRIGETDILIIRTKDLIPGELSISLTGISRDHVRRILLHFLPYREVVKPTFMERSGDWLSRNFPLENEQTKTD